MSERVEQESAEECRLCGAVGLRPVLDLGAIPPWGRLLTAEELSEPEITYPLQLHVCQHCWLAQTPDRIMSIEGVMEYSYSSSYSTRRSEDARTLLDTATARLVATPNTFVVDIVGRGGNSSRHEAGSGIRRLEISPSRGAGYAAIEGGRTMPVLLDADIGAAIRAEHGPADLVVADCIDAPVSDLAEFTNGLRALVADDGWVCIEVRSMLSLVETNEFDTIREHDHYHTVTSARRALAMAGLSVVDAELGDACGGSLRVWARPGTAHDTSPSTRLAHLLEREEAAGLYDLAGYAEFAERVAATRRDLLRFLVEATELGHSVAGYGAPTSGSTLLNHCGVRSDLLPYTAERDPDKHGRFIPGVRIPIVPEARIAEHRPEFVLVLPWQRQGEISAELSYIRAWDGQLVFPLPVLDIVSEF